MEQFGAFALAHPEKADHVHIRPGPEDVIGI